MHQRVSNDVFKKLGKRWNKCLLKLTSFTLCNAHNPPLSSDHVINIGHTQTTHTTQPQA